MAARARFAIGDTVLAVIDGKKCRGQVKKILNKGTAKVRFSEASRTPKDVDANDISGPLEQGASVLVVGHGRPRLATLIDTASHVSCLVALDGGKEAVCIEGQTLFAVPQDAAASKPESTSRGRRGLARDQVEGAQPPKKRAKAAGRAQAVAGPHLKRRKARTFKCPLCGRLVLVSCGRPHFANCNGQSRLAEWPLRRTSSSTPQTDQPAASSSSSQHMAAFEGARILFALGDIDKSFHALKKDCVADVDQQSDYFPVPAAMLCAPSSRRPLWERYRRYSAPQPLPEVDDEVALQALMSESSGLDQPEQQVQDDTAQMSGNEEKSISSPMVRSQGRPSTPMQLPANSASSNAAARPKPLRLASSDRLRLKDAELEADLALLGART